MSQRGEAGGPANYLLGILRWMRAEFLHIPPSKKLSPTLFKRNRFDAIILSDFSRKNTPLASEEAILRQTTTGAGLLMIGGWGSFSGSFGGWRGSIVEKILPVSCLHRKDQVNFPGGAWIISKKKHPMFRSLSFVNPPVICGLNEVRPRSDAQIILAARRIVDKKEFPLLAIDADSRKRIAALATDLAPHWSGGLVDWGKKRIKIRIRKGIGIEVGNLYVRFVSSLLKWLAGGASRD